MLGQVTNPGPSGRSRRKNCKHVTRHSQSSIFRCYERGYTPDLSSKEHRNLPITLTDSGGYTRKQEAQSHDDWKLICKQCEVIVYYRAHRQNQSPTSFLSTLETSLQNGIARDSPNGIQRSGERARHTQSNLVHNRGKKGNAHISGRTDAHTLRLRVLLLQMLAKTFQSSIGWQPVISRRNSDSSFRGD